MNQWYSACHIPTQCTFTQYCQKVLRSSLNHKITDVSGSEVATGIWNIGFQSPISSHLCMQTQKPNRKHKTRKGCYLHPKICMLHTALTYWELIISAAMLQWWKNWSSNTKDCTLELQAIQWKTTVRITWLMMNWCRLHLLKLYWKLADTGFSHEIILAEITNLCSFRLYHKLSVDIKTLIKKEGVFQ